MECPNVWDVISAETKFNRQACKCVIFSMIFGVSNITKIACRYGLFVDDLIMIRIAYDDYVMRCHNEYKKSRSRYTNEIIL